jgi:hypothetical protein
MKKIRILVAVLTLSVAVLSVAGAERGETEKPKKKAKTVKQTVDDLPPAVKATLQAQVGGGKIVEVKQKTKKGRVVFHADVLTNGKDWEIDVVADGTLLKNRDNKCLEDCIYGQEAPAPCETACPMMKVKPCNQQKAQ